MGIVTSLKSNSTAAAPAGRLLAGVVIAQQGAHFLVRSRRSQRWAGRARSCLLLPALGDRVLICCSEGQDLVTDVLTLKDANTTKIETPGDLSLFGGGQLHIETQQGLDVASRGSISFTARSQRWAADKARICFQRFTVAAEEVRTGLRELRSWAETNDSDVQRSRAQLGSASQRLGRGQVHAGDTDLAATETAARVGGATMIRSEGAVTTHGGPIQFG